MDKVTPDLEFFFVYLDNMLVTSRTKEEYEEHLIKFFRLFERQGLKANPAKLPGSSSYDSASVPKASSRVQAK
ncbi:hypothetical protein T12_11870 [Trichinella patagoniensis]|uniref:Reverse transcriptase domain-containing protein n=1 Tax=Trichinella patagoniensis TaxID=990121 RepID=A0A0V0Z755_9BILA|nr:hypothetical protein T12_11870 [Trichinella patagoniensis]